MPAPLSVLNLVSNQGGLIIHAAALNFVTVIIGHKLNLNLNLNHNHFFFRSSDVSRIGLKFAEYGVGAHRCFAFCMRNLEYTNQISRLKTSRPVSEHCYLDLYVA